MFDGYLLVTALEDSAMLLDDAASLDDMASLGDETFSLDDEMLSVMPEELSVALDDSSATLLEVGSVALQQVVSGGKTLDERLVSDEELSAVEICAGAVADESSPHAESMSDKSCCNDFGRLFHVLLLFVKYKLESECRGVEIPVFVIKAFYGVLGHGFFVKGKRKSI